ncbi:MAG: HD domain-containing phosphohydrolase [Georgfuchsia sp.]
MNTKQPDHETRSATILIVEDSPVQAELLRRELERAGYGILTASNGVEGLAMVKAQRPDAVVSDINMPLMDGYTMCHAIRHDDALKATPVILLTMLSDPQDVVRGLSAGADGYVTKPYNVPSLIARIESLLAYPPDPPPDVERRKITYRLAGESHTVDAHGQRILNLLISTYENAVLQNRELALTQQALEDLNQHLEQKVLEQTAELRESEQRFRALIENASDLVLVLDAQGRFTYLSPPVRRVGGYEPGEMLGKCFMEFVHPDDIPTANADFSALMQNPHMLHTAQLRYLCKGGDWIILETVSKNAIDDPAISGIIVNARDITERKQGEFALERANRALRTLSACNVALVHSRSEAELLDTICRLIVETGGYRLAWVGFPEQDPEKMVRPVAHFGHDAGYMAEAKISWADTELGSGPTGMAIRSGTVQLNQNTLTNPAMAPWRGTALKRGFQSSIALPLKNSMGTLGALTIYASEPNAFNETEVTLLQELAGDLAFGIETLHVRAERDRIAYEQQHHEEILRQSLEQSIQAIADTVEARDPYTAGHQRRVAELAVSIAWEMGLAEERIHGIRLAASIHDLGKIQVPAEILAKPSKLTDIEFMLIKGHPKAGYDILKDIEFPWPIATMVLQHHERLDGSGYPHRLKDGQILLESCILAVADVVEAMSSHRPYRPGLGIEAALEEIERQRGGQYDPKAVDACIKLFRERGYKLPN